MTTTHRPPDETSGGRLNEPGGAPVRIVVPFDANVLSLNKRLHWRSRHRLNQQAKEAARLAWMQAGSPRLRGPVAVTVTLHRGRKVDPDNALGALKPLVDALFKDGITPDDSAEWVAFRPVRQVPGKEYRGAECVVFEVELEGAAGQ